MDTPSIGRFVHYVLPDGQHRPAVIVQDWSDRPVAPVDEEKVNLVVFVDGGNDNRMHDGQFLVPNASGENLAHWRTSVRHDEDQAPDTWHWPERV